MTDVIHGDGAFRRRSLHGSAIENTYAGALSFMRRNYQVAFDAPPQADSWNAFLAAPRTYGVTLRLSL
jgi:hypothetical protein